jgi:heat shock protein HslJ
LSDRRERARDKKREHLMNSSRFQFFTVVLFLVFALGPSSLALAGGPGPGITGVQWKWAETKYSNDTEAIPPDPSHYTLMLNEDGTIAVRADCNRAGGTWKGEDSRITITVTHSTMAMCPPESLDSVYLKDLARAAIYFFRDGNLYFDMPYDSGTMKFKRP